MASPGRFLPWVGGSCNYLPHTQPTSKFLPLDTWQGPSGLEPWSGVKCAEIALIHLHKGTQIHSLTAPRARSLKNGAQGWFLVEAQGRVDACLSQCREVLHSLAQGSCLPLVRTPG